MEKTRLLFLIPNLMHGGAEKVLVNLVNNLDKERYDITVQTLFDVGVHKKSILPHVHYKSVFKHQFKGNSHVFACFSPRTLYKTFIKEKYDIAVAYLEGVAARIISGCPYSETKKVAFIHIEQTDEKVFSQGFKNIDEARACYNKFDTIAFVSKTVEPTFTKYMDEIKPKLCVKYNVNEVEKIAEKAKEEVSDIVFEKDVVNFVSVAKIIPAKGYDRLARVHKRLLDAGFKHKIYILGVGEQQASIEKYLKENLLENSFFFLGFRDNPYKYVQKADVYVCSSYKEGFSTAVTESLIVGTPVVTTLCSGMEELLGENDEFGIIVESSEDGLYDGMKRMIESRELIAHYREKALLRAEKFSRLNTVRAYEEMFDELLCKEQA